MTEDSMEVKLDHIIEKIKADGVEQANQEAAEIKQNAKKEADKIIENARKEAEKVVSDAEKEVADFEEKSKRALQLAVRDTQLLVKEKLTDLFDRAFKQKVSDSLDPEFLHKMILKIVENWDEKKSAEIELSEADKKQIEPLLAKSLQDELKDSVTLQVSDRVSKGFRIRREDEDLYYDLTDENIAEILYLFINPKLKAILENDNG
jgi:V/A-type H+-transporting ATPase subunit E